MEARFPAGSRWEVWEHLALARYLAAAGVDVLENLEYPASPVRAEKANLR